MAFSQGDEVDVHVSGTWHQATVAEVRPTKYGCDLATPTKHSVLYGSAPRYGDSGDKEHTRVWVPRRDSGVEDIDKIRARA
jgi:hypothetical protein